MRSDSSTRDGRLRRAESEAWLVACFRVHIESDSWPPNVELPPRRLAGLFELLRDRADWKVARNVLFDAQKPSRERRWASAAYLDALSSQDLQPAAHHLLALYYAHAGHAVIKLGKSALATAHFRRSLGHWLRVALQGTYLEEQWRALGVSAKDAGAETQAFFTRQVEAIAAHAEGPAASPSAREAAILVLAEPLAIWRGAACDEGALAWLREKLVHVCERIAADMVLTYESAMLESKARGDSAKARADSVLLGLPLWQASAGAREVERAVLFQAEEVGWDLRRARDWSTLEHMYHALEKVVLSFADRVEKDSEQFAFTSRAAQALVFLADAKKDLDLRIAHTERALRICPGHPTAKTMLAFYLATKGLRHLRGVSRISAEFMAEARALHARGLELDPKDEKVIELGNEIEAKKRLVF